MPDINDTLNETEWLLNQLLDSNDANIAKSLKKLEKKLVSLYHNYIPSGGKNFTIVESQKLQRELIQVIERDYGILTNAVTKDYDKISDIIEWQFKELELPFELPASDRKLITALKKTASTQFRQFSTQTETLLHQSLLDGVAGGTAFSGMVDDMRNILTGLADKVGRPLRSHATRVAHDGLMGYFQAIQNKAGQAAGLTKWLYYGDIVGSSRAWCIAHVGKTYTKKQIDNWNKYTWKGKAKGRNVWVARGGYNCRHHFLAIKPEWIESGDLKVQNYFNENPTAYTPKLRKEVNSIINKGI